MSEMTACPECREEWDETDMMWTEDGPLCPDCWDRAIDAMMPTMSEMAALSRSTARVGCSGCGNRHDPDKCPYWDTF